MTRFIEIDSQDVRFVADTHFRDPSVPGEAGRRRRFLEFLESLSRGTALFLLGDIFDFYFEYRSYVSKRYFDLFGAFADCRSRGVELHFLGGNHDYWVGDFVARNLGMTLHAKEILVAAQGRKIVCAHGDLIIPRDWGYKILKTIIRNRFVIGVSRWIHPDIMDSIATGVSAAGRKSSKASQAQRARRLAHESSGRFYVRGNDAFIMGHVHSPIHHADGGRDFLIVGDWVTDFTYGKLSGGKLSLESFTGSATN